MASGQTSRYGLSQWQPEDKVLREEFNGDNGKVDAALGGLADQMNTKAGQADLDGVKTQLATKAAQSALDSLSASVTAGLAKKYGTDNPYIKTGTYLGSGNDAVSVTLGFRPSYLMVIAQYPDYVGQLDFVFLHGTGDIQLTVRQGGSTSPETDALEFFASGFTVPASQSEAFNIAGLSYRYIAFR